MPDSNELMAEFQTKFHLTTSITQYEKMSEKIHGINDYLFTRPTGREGARMAYVEAVKYFVDQHVKYLTSYRTDFRPNALVDSIESLVQDYENIMQTRHEEKFPKGDVPRARFEGAYPAVLDTIRKSLAPANKPLSEVWAKQIMKNTINLETVRQTTNKIHQDTLNDGLSTDVEERAAETAIMMYRTMQEVVKKRGFFWGLWPWNWDRRDQEKAYLSELEEQVKTYERFGLEKEDVYEKYNGPIYGNDFESRMIAKKEDYLEERKKRVAAAKTGSKEKMKGIELGNASKAPAQKISALQRVEEVAERGNYPSEFAQAIESVLPAANYHGTAKIIIQLNFSNKILDPIKAANSVYDKNAEAGKKAMENCVKDLYKDFFELSKDFGYTKIEDRIAATQIIVDKAMKELSPAAFDPDYAEFANGYMLEHGQDVHKELGVTDEELAGGKSVYHEIVPEKLNLEEFEKPQNGPVSAPVEKPNVISAPNIQTGK